MSPSCLRTQIIVCHLPRFTTILYNIMLHKLLFGKQKCLSADFLVFQISIAFNTKHLQVPAKCPSMSQSQKCSFFGQITNNVKT
ncbi:hypothetical protein XENTR_v10014475 [Xenopus tropicalis]|nr:hypothetical protein XENTR_v10014475 [Xenopus tropicalis]